MNITGWVPDKATRAISKTALWASKNAPSILVVSGTAGLIATTVVASRAAIRAHEYDFPEIRDNIKNVKEDVPREIRTGALFGVYADSAWMLTKRFGPALILGAASTAAILGGHGLLRRRHAALFAAFTATEQSFAEYRARVEREIGEDKALYLEQTKTEENEDGEETTSSAGLMYARVFDRSNPLWENDSIYNERWLKLQQSHFNDILRRRGHVFLNDVYRSLGFKDTPEGALVGWVYNSEEGDNYIDFSISDLPAAGLAHLLEEHGPNAFFLDFNVDGVIYDLI